MAQIQVSDLTFCYEGSFDNIFEKVSFSIDTDWKLGFIGRNGKGKTTFFKLLLGELEYQGRIQSSACFDYFPYQIEVEKMDWNTIDVIESLDPSYELWKICRELDLLRADAELLYRPYQTLSYGERTKVMLSILFSRDHFFLLIDEPTNHLDQSTRVVVRDYLQRKKGFILISHDRWLLDECVDHVLVLNRQSITVEQGNFSSWWENKQKKDAYELSENEKLKQEIRKMESAARQRGLWADKAEGRKIGYDPIKEHDRLIGTRAYIGAKSKKMQQNRKNLERRQQAAVEERKGLLKDIEATSALKVMPLKHHREVYIRCKNMDIFYGTKEVVEQFQMELKRGERILLQGDNGCGKSSVLKTILSSSRVTVLGGLPEGISCEQRSVQGELELANGLVISYINQDTSHLQGKLDEYIQKLGLDESIFKAILRQLDFERIQFEKRMEQYSEGQKKKVLITGSLLARAHLYIWDEPLNYIDVFSRMQIEKLIEMYQPTMLFVEHDKTFGDHIATQIVKIP